MWADAGSCRKTEVGGWGHIGDLEAVGEARGGGTVMELDWGGNNCGVEGREETSNGEPADGDTRRGGRGEGVSHD